MSSKARISHVTPVAGRPPLRVEWANGREDTVNLTAFIREHAVLAPLIDPATFKRAQVGEWGFDVTWVAIWKLPPPRFIAWPSNRPAK